ncbi:MAG: hypothetical protein R2879_13645 [Saprospiraceae bacterium]
MNSTTISIKNLFFKKEISRLEDAMQYIHQLPYGRNADRANYMLVLEEEKGTCSTKHALLKAFAMELGEDKVQLFLGVYKMMEENTPGIGKVLDASPLNYIPEAHCYLKVEGKRVDLTSQNADISKVEKGLLEEQEILPDDIGDYKVNYHKNFIRNWLKMEYPELTFEEVWQLREACIAALSQ